MKNIINYEEMMFDENNYKKPKNNKEKKKFKIKDEFTKIKNKKLNKPKHYFKDSY